MRLVAYSRCDGEVLNGRQDEIRKYCKIHPEIEIVDYLHDLSVTDANLWNLFRTLDESPNLLDGLIVTSLKQLGSNFSDCADVLNYLDEKGKVLVVVEQDLSTNCQHNQVLVRMLLSLVWGSR